MGDNLNDDRDGEVSVGAMASVADEVENTVAFGLITEAAKLGKVKSKIIHNRSNY